MHETYRVKSKIRCEKRTIQGTCYFGCSAYSARNNTQFWSLYYTLMREFFCLGNGRESGIFKPLTGLTESWVG